VGRSASAGIARRSGEGAAWAAVRGTFACAIGWSGERRSAAEDHAECCAAPLRPAVRRGVPVFGPDEVQVRGGRTPGEGARGEGGRAGTSAGERGLAAEKHPSSAACVRGGGLRPKRAPQRVGRLFGRALAARSAERFIGWLRKWGGGMGDAELGGRSAGLSGSGSGECAALMPGRSSRCSAVRRRRVRPPGRRARDEARRGD